VSNHRSTRGALALLIAITGLIGLAAPASAVTIIQMCNGDCGYYEIGDSGPPYGANCQYENASHDLDKVSVRPPSIHGPYSQYTKVRWLLRVFRSGNMGGSWSQIYQSSWQNAMANDAIPARAGSGFSRRAWVAPENPTGWYKVRLLMHWFNQSGNRVGIAAVELDYYKLLNNAVGNTMDHCGAQWM
jgi:hypothetical protein